MIYYTPTFPFHSMTEAEIKSAIDHITHQNDVIVSTLIKILEAIDSKEIQGIRIQLQEKLLN